jgi:type III secretion protein U
MFADRTSGLFEFALSRVDLDAPNAMSEIGMAALKTFLILTVVPLGIVGAIGMLTEFLQVGVVFAPKKITPDMTKLNPADGLKRVFSMDNLFELAKSILKTTLLATLIVLVIRHYLADILEVPAAGMTAYIGLDQRLIVALGGWTVLLFAFISIADFIYQKYSHRKRLRMSKADVKREHKQEEGDPHLRHQRKALQRQWSRQNVREAAREATALLVNPTHIAVAIRYEPEETAVPMITAKGEGDLAKLMRQEAEAAGVPIIRDVLLARALNYYGDEEDFIPEEYFDAVAEIIAWAERVRGTDAVQSRS